MQPIQRRRTLTHGAIVIVAAALAGCGEGVFAPQDVSPSFAVGDAHSLVDVPDPGLGFVCAFYHPDGDYGPSTFSVTATGGTVIGGDFQIALPGAHCVEVWNATDDATVELTASVVDSPDNLLLDRVVTFTGVGPIVTTLTGVSTATIDVSDLLGGTIWFKFERQDAPPGGGQGCTPGYWRQEQHFDSWTAPYDPTDLFSSVFDDAFPGETLLDVVWARGGGVNALGRHAVAALLNAASADVSYDLSVDAVISAFNDANATGDKHLMNDQKDVFDFLNKQGCPLN